MFDMKISANKGLKGLPREHIQNLLDICLNQNYYIFNNTYYRQKEGLSMGSPLITII